MIATLRRSYAFESAHRLPHVPAGHKCGRVHGHSYRVTVVVRGTVQTSGPEAGMVVDFARVDHIARPLVDALDHQSLNDVLPNPTSELLAAWFIERLRALPHLHSVVVSETERSECEVFAEDCP